MPIYTFLCHCGNKWDGIVPYDTKLQRCAVCDRLAKREAIEVPARRDPEHGIQK